MATRSVSDNDILAKACEIIDSDRDRDSLADEAACGWRRDIAALACDGHITAGPDDAGSLLYARIRERFYPGWESGDFAKLIEYVDVLLAKS